MQNCMMAILLYTAPPCHHILTSTCQKEINSYCKPCHTKTFLKLFSHSLDMPKVPNAFGNAFAFAHHLCCIYGLFIALCLYDSNLQKDSVDNDCLVWMHMGKGFEIKYVCTRSKYINKAPELDSFLKQSLNEASVHDGWRHYGKTTQASIQSCAWKCTTSSKHALKLQYRA